MMVGQVNRVGGLKCLRYKNNLCNLSRGIWKSKENTCGKVPEFCSALSVPKRFSLIITYVPITYYYSGSPEASKNVRNLQQLELFIIACIAMQSALM